MEKLPSKADRYLIINDDDIIPPDFPVVAWIPVLSFWRC
jgi:hypothetical protein